MGKTVSTRTLGSSIGPLFKLIELILFQLPSIIFYIVLQLNELKRRLY